MKLNPDCVRDILSYLESLDYEKTSNIEKLHKALPLYSEDELSYCCLKLKEASFLNVETLNMARHPLPQISKIYDITYLGHQFLESVRSDNVWSKTKSIAQKLGTFSINALSSIASNVISELIKNSFS